MSCVKCKLPVSERQQPWFLGWLSDGNCGWLHRKCHSDESILPGSPIAQSTRLDEPNDCQDEGRADDISLMEISAQDDLDSSMQDTPDEVRIEQLEQLEADRSFALNTDDVMPLPNDKEESSFEEQPIGELTTTEPVQLTYEKIEEASQRKSLKLVDSHGYSYNVKERSKSGTTTWQCTVRNKSNYCKATVREKNGEFIKGKHSHNHSGMVGAGKAAKIITEVKRKALEDIFRPASAIVDEVLVNGMTGSAPCTALPKPEHIARTANRLRQRLRPKDPKDLDFEVDLECIPKEFLRDDIKVKDRRHFVFATIQQLGVLSNAKTWYLDGTFKVVGKPFTQLVTINAFVRSGECAKQVPLIFVLMSSKKKKDYKKVLKSIINMLPHKPKVEQAVLDFEKAMWGAIREVIPEIQLRGCAFHWTQALWRKIQELGLATAYSEDEGYHRYLRKLMALPFLPDQEIPEVFTSLKVQANTDALTILTEYVQQNWIEGSMFSPKDWSVYGQAIRTNNDIEGWHNALNRRASGRIHLPFYMLVKLLYQEANLTAIQIRLVSQRRLKRIQRRKYRSLQSRVQDLWEQYASGSKTAMNLLKSCSYLHGPPRME